MDAGTISAWGTMLSAIAAAVAAYLTYRSVQLSAHMVDEMRAARQPAVFVDLEIDSYDTVILVVGNNGDASAQRIRFEWEDRIPWRSDMKRTPHDIPALRDGIAYLAPGRVLRFYAGMLDWDMVTSNGGKLNVRTRFKGESGQTFDTTAYFDLANYEGISTDTFSPAGDRIASHLREMVHMQRTDSLKNNLPRVFTSSCPACSKKIPTGAKKCHWCLEWLPSASPSTHEDQEAPAPGAS